MLDIFAVIKTVVEVAGGVHRHLSDRSKTKQAAAETKTSAELTGKVHQLEQAELEHAQLLDDVSQNLAELGKAIAIEVERNRARDAWVARLVYVTLGTSILALAIALVALLR